MPLARRGNRLVGGDRHAQHLPWVTLASQTYLQEIHCLWRPFLADADNDMVLELAFAAGCRHIVTHNVKDFHGSEQLGVFAITPRDFLN
jgi:hypothetical protein